MRAVVLVALAGCSVASAQAGSGSADKPCLEPKAIVDAVAAKQLDGRAPGTEGDRAARAIITEQLKCRGLTPAAQDFDRTANILATIPGSTDEIVMITAHHDHLGS